MAHCSFMVTVVRKWLTTRNRPPKRGLWRTVHMALALVAAAAPEHGAIARLTGLTMFFWNV